MTTAIQPARETRTREHRRGSGRPDYRPANAPRTSIRTLEPASPSTEPTVAAPVVSAAPPSWCEQCARTRRFEAAVGRTIRRFLVVVALAAVAALTGGNPTAPTRVAAHSAPAAQTPTATTTPPAPATASVLASPASGCAVPFALVGPCSPFGR